MASQTELKESDENMKQLQLARKLFPRYRKRSLMPIIRGTVGLGLFAIACLIIDKKYFKEFSMLKLRKSGWFLLAYLIGIFLLRIKETQTTSVCLELLWGCNLALFSSAIGCIYGRPLLVGISIGLVGLDQTIWYMDVISFMIRRKYLLGAAGYLSDPEQTYIRSITSLHHLWFLPFAMSTLYVGKSYLNTVSFPLSMFLGLLSMVYGRLGCPKYVWYPLTNAVKRSIERKSHARKSHKSHKSKTVLVDKENGYYLQYMNVNLGHEFYPTVPLSFLHYCNKSPIYIYLPITAVLLTSASYIPFVAMTKISQKYMFLRS